METENKQEGKLWLALLLSFLVCVGGAILWGLIYSFGWFISLIALITALCAFVVYEKIYKKTTKLTFIWVLTWIVLLNAIASFIAIVVSVAISAGVDFGEALNATISVFDQVMVDFLFDIFLGAVFGVLGVVTYYQYQKRTKQAKLVQEQIIEAQLKAQNNVQDEVSEENETLNENESKKEVLRCSQCGAMLNEGSKTCEFCGKKN